MISRLRNERKNEMKLQQTLAIINKRDLVERLYLEWVNNFISIERFCEYFKLTLEQAKKVIKIGEKMFK